MQVEALVTDLDLSIDSTWNFVASRFSLLIRRAYGIPRSFDLAIWRFRAFLTSKGSREINESRAFTLKTEIGDCVSIGLKRMPPGARDRDQPAHLAIRTLSLNENFFNGSRHLISQVKCSVVSSWTSEFASGSEALGSRNRIGASSRRNIPPTKLPKSNEYKGQHVSQTTKKWCTRRSQLNHLQIF